MFPGSPIQAIVDAKRSGGASLGPTFGLGSNPMGGMIKPKPKPPGQTFMGSGDSSQWGGTNVLR